MARDPIQHDLQVLHEALRRIEAGEQLDDMPTVRDELIHLGLVFVAHDGLLIMTKEGRAFFDVS